MSMTWALYNFRDGSHFIKNYIALDFLSSPHFFEGVVFRQECLKGDDLTRGILHLNLGLRSTVTQGCERSLSCWRVGPSQYLESHVDAVCTRHVHFACLWVMFIWIKPRHICSADWWSTFQLMVFFSTFPCKGHLAFHHKHPKPCKTCLWAQKKDDRPAQCIDGSRIKDNMIISWDYEICRHAEIRMFRPYDLCNLCVHSHLPTCLYKRMSCQYIQTYKISYIKPQLWMPFRAYRERLVMHASHPFAVAGSARLGRSLHGGSICLRSCCGPLMPLPQEPCSMFISMILLAHKDIEIPMSLLVLWNRAEESLAS